MEWLLRASELDAALDEEGSRRYIAYTCQTDDPAREQAYLDFIETIVPRIKPWHDKLGRLYLASPARARADRERLRVLDRWLENDVKLFREENIPLQTEDAKLGQQYQKICGAMMVRWRSPPLSWAKGRSARCVILRRSMQQATTWVSWDDSASRAPWWANRPSRTTSRTVKGMSAGESCCTTAM